MPAVGLYRAAGFFRGYLFLREGSPTHPLYTHYMSVGVWVQMYAISFYFDVSQVKSPTAMK